MSQLIIGLFNSVEQAATVTQELISIGVEVGQIATIAPVVEQPADGDAAAQPDPAQVATALREAGLTEQQATTYAEAVRNGATALIVAPSEIPGANIKAVMLSHGSLGIDADAPEPNTLGQAPHLEPESEPAAPDTPHAPLTSEEVSAVAATDHSLPEERRGL